MARDQQALTEQQQPGTNFDTQALGVMLHCKTRDQPQLCSAAAWPLALQLQSAYSYELCARAAAAAFNDARSKATTVRLLIGPVPRPLAATGFGTGEPHPADHSALAGPNHSQESLLQQL